MAIFTCDHCGEDVSYVIDLCPDFLCKRCFETMAEADVQMAGDKDYHDRVVRVQAYLDRRR